METNHPLVWLKTEEEKARESHNFVGFKFQEGRGLAQDPETKLFYHINRLMVPAYPERYLALRDYHEGSAAAEEKPGKWCHIGPTGKPLYSERYDEIGDSRCGLAWARLGNKYFFISPHTGKRAFGDTTWAVAGDMIGGYAEVKNNDNPDVITIDATGNIVKIDKIRSAATKRKRRHSS